MECEPTPEVEKSTSRVAKAFGLENSTIHGARLVKIIAILFPAFAASFQISTTFYLIHIAETLGGGDYVTGLTFVGVLVAVQLGIQTMLDYPTGVVGDWIGQRYVISSALFCYAVSFWLVSLITPESPFYIFLVIYALFGLGASQESGAFHAWFDNNYRVAMPQDKNREQYGVVMGKLGMLFQLSSTLVLIPGAWLALIFSRMWVFQIQAIISVILALAVLRLVKDLPGVREESEERPTFGEYVGILKEGVRFLGSSRFVTFIVLGEVILFCIGPIWWNLQLFPTYYMYLVTAIAVASFRTWIFLPTAILQERSGVWARRFEPKKWIWRFRLLQFSGFFFYVFLALITLVFPAASPNSDMYAVYIPFTNLALIEVPVESVVPVILIFTVFLVLGIFGNISGILSQRVMIDVIPTKIRNSMYSLTPTLIMLLSLPLIVFFGWFIPLYGFSATFILCALIPLVGAFLIRHAFSHPIPKAQAVAIASEEEQEEIEELDVT